MISQWIPAQLHSEADASKDGETRPHIRLPYTTEAGYENLAGFRPGLDMISGATLVITGCMIFHGAQNFVLHQWISANTVEFSLSCIRLRLS